MSMEFELNTNLVYPEHAFRPVQATFQAAILNVHSDLEAIPHYQYFGLSDMDSDWDENTGSVL